MFTPFSLEFYLNCYVSIEIQGRSSTDCNFQGLSRTFKVRASPVISRSLASNPAWVKEESENNNQEKKPN